MISGLVLNKESSMVRIRVYIWSLKQHITNRNQICIKGINGKNRVSSANMVKK